MGRIMAIRLTRGPAGSTAPVRIGAMVAAGEIVGAKTLLLLQWARGSGVAGPA